MGINIYDLTFFLYPSVDNKIYVNNNNMMMMNIRLQYLTKTRKIPSIIIIIYDIIKFFLSCLRLTAF